MTHRHSQADTRPTSITEAALEQAAQGERWARQGRNRQLAQQVIDGIAASHGERREAPWERLLSPWRRARLSLSRLPWYVRIGLLASPLAVLGAVSAAQLLYQGVGGAGVALLALGGSTLYIGQEAWRWAQAGPG